MLAGAAAEYILTGQWWSEQSRTDRETADRWARLLSTNATAYVAQTLVEVETELRTPEMWAHVEALAELLTNTPVLVGVAVTQFFDGRGLKMAPPPLSRR
jgi:hypothetical protein